MFLFRLARDLGKTVSEIKSQMTSEEFTYWMAFYDYENKKTLEQIKKTKKP
jgi:Sec-independent protein translocase protein TatA